MSLATLRAKYPWPAVEAFQGAAVSQPAGWLQGGTASYLVESLPDIDAPDYDGRPVIVVELGAWKGLSTNFLLGYATHVISVDHWKGSTEHQGREDLEDLFETWCRNCAWRKEDVTPLRMDTTRGLYQVYAHGIEPALIYMDASHEYGDVYADLQQAAGLFPFSWIVGDDWNWEGPGKDVPVQRAVRKCAHELGLSVEWNDTAFRVPPRVSP